MIRFVYVLGGSRQDISGMDKMILPWKYGAYLPTLPLSYSSGLFCKTFQNACVAISVGLCPGGIGLPEEIESGQPVLSLLAARSSSLAEKAS